jgi:uncharacterized protein YjbJ (UPF0337 family)
MARVKRTAGSISASQSLRGAAAVLPEVQESRQKIESKHHRRNTMKSSTKDQAEGTFHEVKGKLMEATGKLTDNPRLEGEGLGEKIAGKVQKKVGEIERVLEK